MTYAPVLLPLYKNEKSRLFEFAAEHYNRDSKKFIPWESYGNSDYKVRSKRQEEGLEIDVGYWPVFRI